MLTPENFPMNFDIYLSDMERYHRFERIETVSVWEAIFERRAAGSIKVTHSDHLTILRGLEIMFLSNVGEIGLAIKALYLEAKDGAQTYTDTDSMHVETTPIFDRLFSFALGYLEFHDGCTIDFKTGRCVNHDSGVVFKLNPANRVTYKRYPNTIAEIEHGLEQHVKRTTFDTPIPFTKPDDV